MDDFSQIEGKIKHLEESGLQSIRTASTPQQFEEIKVRFLGRSGEITQILKSLKDLPADIRPRVGAEANRLKGILEAALSEQLSKLQSVSQQARLQESIDVTLPGQLPASGAIHPITTVMNEMVAVLSQLGYTIAEGPEIEDEAHNFDKLNIPKDHPARDMHDTFYLKNGTLLRTHTSPVQIHVMEKQKPPLAVMAPGRVYRCDSDATHSPVFHQVEAFYVGKNIRMSDLKGTLTYFLQALFGKERNVRLRPSFFPFTEPSAEVDVSCGACQGKGCRLCKNTGWIEILGAGMIHPNVLRAVKIDPKIWSGFAFGVGVERVVMLKYGVTDIRHLMQNDLRFLSQFHKVRA